MKKQQNLPLIITIVVCTLLIVFSILFLAFKLQNNGAVEIEQSNRQEGVSQYTEGVNPNVGIESSPFIGSADADIVIVEYSDYQCPFCRSFYENAYQQIKTNYVDTNIVKFVFKDFPLDFHQDAMFAANAAKCARVQTDDATYFAFHDQIFDIQGSFLEGTVAITDGMIASIADNLKLETKTFNKCLTDKRFYQEVAADYLGAFEQKAEYIAEMDGVSQKPVVRKITEEENNGVNATPTLFVNNVKIVGAQPYEVFEEAINFVKK